MTDARKHIRAVIPANKARAFDEAKRRAEDASMIKLTDTQYASRLIQWALDKQSDTA